MHSILFSSFYSAYRCHYLKLLFIAQNIRHYKAALHYLLFLNDNQVRFNVAVFILMAINSRKSIMY